MLIGMGSLQPSVPFPTMQKCNIETFLKFLRGEKSHAATNSKFAKQSEDAG